MDDLDWSVAARCVAQRCKIHDYRSHSELQLLLKDYAETNQMQPEYAINKFVLGWDNYVANMGRLRVTFGSPMAFFRWPGWDVETLWPWIRIVPRATVGAWVDDGRSKNCQIGVHDCGQDWCSCDCHQQKSPRAV